MTTTQPDGLASEEAPIIVKVSMVGAATGALVLAMVALPLFFLVVMMSLFELGAVPWFTLCATASVGLVPVPLAAGIAWV